MHATRAILVAIPFLLLSGPTLAKNQGKLPADAKPMSTATIEKLYAGKTYTGRTVRFYLAPDHKFLGVSNSGSFGDGTWTVKGNELCHNTTWYKKESPPYPSSWCKAFYMSKGEIWIDNTKDRDEWIGDKYRFDDSEKAKLVNGDRVSTEALALKKSLGL